MVQKVLKNLLDSKIKSGRKIYNYKKNVPPIFHWIIYKVCVVKCIVFYLD